MVVFRTLVCAKPSTIWQVNFASMQWEKWDPDVQRIEDVEGDMSNGSSLVFVMNDGKKIKTTISDVVKEKKFTFSGSLLGGLACYTGTFSLTPETSHSATASHGNNDGQTEKTEVEYAFEMNGFLGGPVGYFFSNAVENGTKVGLENVKKFSEEAEKA
eukprot:Awhi_evm1s620